MNKIDEKLHPILAEVLRRNAGEVEFHQAVHEVLESLGRVVHEFSSILAGLDCVWGSLGPILWGLWAFFQWDFRRVSAPS